MKTPRNLIPPQALKFLSLVSWWKSPLLIVTIYLFVFLLAFIGGTSSQWYLAPLSILLIGGLQHHLLILLHEGAHFLLHPNKKINDFWGDLFCAIPFFTLQKNYRIFHLTHHRFSGDPEKDPEADMYASMGHFYQKRSKKDFLQTVVFVLLGYHTLKFILWTLKFQQKMIKSGRLEKPGTKELILNLLFWGTSIGLTTYFGVFHYIVIFWIIPYLFVAMPCLILHGFGEHSGSNSSNEFDKTLTHHFNPIVNYFLYPIKSGYHLDHHVFPTIPWYNVNSLRRELKKNSIYCTEIKKQTVNGYFWGKQTVSNSILLQGAKTTSYSNNTI